MTRSTIHTTSHEVVTDDYAFEVRVSYTARAGSPAVLWGDYPHPGDDPEFEIVKVEIDDYGEWVPFTLTAADEEAALSYIAENHDFRDEGPDPDDAYDRRRDDALMGLHL